MMGKLFVRATKDVKGDSLRLSYNSAVDLVERSCSEILRAKVDLEGVTMSPTVGRCANDCRAVNQVQSPHHNLGELRSVHRPSTFRIWLMALIALALLAVIALVVVLAIESVTSATQSKGSFFDRFLAPLGCAGVLGLLFACRRFSGRELS